MVVVVLLSTLNFPLYVGTIRIDLFGAIELGASLDEPVGCHDAASVGAVAAEAAVVLLGEVEEAFA